MFYDNPEIIFEEKDMRMNLGFLLRVPSKAAFEHFEKKGYKVKELPKAKCVSSTFPCVINHISYPLGAQKVYPALRKHLGENKRKYGDDLFENP